MSQAVYCLDMLNSEALKIYQYLLTLTPRTSEAIKRYNFVSLPLTLLLLPKEASVEALI